MQPTPIQSEETSGSEADVDEPHPALPAPKQKPRNGNLAPATPCTPGKRYWIMDTGCPDDLISRKTMPPDCKPHIETAEVAQAYDTANGSLKVDQTVDMQIESIGVASPYVLPSTPDVLNVGRRCEKEGYEFHWNAFSKKPYMIKPSAQGGQRIQLVSIGCVPYLIDSFNPDGLSGTLPACPAPTAAKLKTKRASSAPTPRSRAGDGVSNAAVPASSSTDVPPATDAPEAVASSSTDVPPPPPPFEGDVENRSKAKKALIKEAKSVEHMLTHTPFNPYCRACVQARSKRHNKRKGKLAVDEPIPAEWGLSVTGDHCFQTRA